MGLAPAIYRCVQAVICTSLEAILTLLISAHRRVQRELAQLTHGPNFTEATAGNYCVPRGTPFIDPSQLYFYGVAAWRFLRDYSLDPRES